MSVHSKIDQGSTKMSINSSSESRNSEKLENHEISGNEQSPEKEYIEGDAGDGTTREEQILHGTQLYLCLASCLLSFFLVALDTTITAALLSDLGNRFNAFDKVSWITAGFLLSTGCLTQVWGIFGVVFGRKWIMIVGIAIFEIGSLISGLANSMDMLIGGRVIQGIGAASIQTLTFMILAEITTIDKKPLVFAGLAGVFAISSVIGPLVGGAFDTYVTWRWCFYLNLVCGGVALPMFYISFHPRTPPGTILSKLKKIDYFDCFLCISSIVLVILALSFGVTDYAWNSAAVISCFVLGGVLGVGFIIWNFWFSSDPIILRSIVLQPQLMAATLSMSFGYASFSVIVQFISVYFQVVQGYNSISTGISLFPMIIPVTIFSILSGLLVKKTRRMKPFAILACVLMLIGCGLLTLLKVKETLSRRVGLLILSGVATGFIMQPNVMAIQILAPKEPGGLLLSTAFQNFFKNVLAAIFSVISQVIYTETLKSNINAISDKVSTTENLMILVTKTTLIKTLSDSDQIIVKSAILKSIHNTFYFAIASSAVSFIFSLFTGNLQLPKKQAEVEREVNDEKDGEP